MDHCRTARFLRRFLPVRRWQALLLERHARSCPECRKFLASVEEARRATMSPSAPGQVKDFWPEFVRNLEAEAPSSAPSRPARGRWWMALAGSAAAGLAVAVALLTGPPPAGILDLKAKVIIRSSEIFGQPAQTIIFQTPDVDRTFIWVEQINKGEQP